ncbi:MAG TPA: ABC transporter permease [Actinophytocola sp.]|uniref:ABC transporter permease n=1 Tax=Actinophytocola sp. TaxID=1872138 RepID=UPI002DBB0668|nr:ABC transporter permease [Actinophytocola sp.]HEU5472667.1 ABC transporter permease [Actinophytocola sp.]
MTTISHALTDSATMLRRNLRHAMRYPALSLSGVAVPVIFLLVFVYVLGGTLGAGIPGGSYIDYLAPGIILMTVTSATVAAAVAISVDLTGGIIARFRTMAIFRPAVLAGHVAGYVIQTMLSVVIVIGVALLVGFRPTATPVEWLAVIGLLAVLGFALTWLSTALGMLAKNPETASNIVLPLTLLPLIGSTFVPTASMSAPVAAFAENQPFTPVTETIRGLLMGTQIGTSGILALGWCVLFTVVGYLWSKRLFNRRQR